MPKHVKTSKNDLQDAQDNNSDDNNNNASDESEDEPVPPPQSVKPPKTKPKKYIPLKQQPNYKIVNTSFDPTVNIQILEQLKLLGNELKYEREKKQQKQLIKHQINKQLNHHQQQAPKQIIYKQEPEYEYDEPEPIINEPQPQPPTQQYIPKRRRLDLRNI